MKWIVLAIATLLAGLCVPGIHTSMQRSNQKRTMAVMRTVAERIEKGERVDGGKDAWGHPLLVRRAGLHYSIRAAAADGRFEAAWLPPANGAPYILTRKFSADMVLMGGRFVQFPEGICFGDEPGKGPLGDCASCHPQRIQKR